MTESVFVSRNRWYALGARSLKEDRPERGQIVAYDYAAWRVVAVRWFPAEKWSNEDRAALAEWMHERPTRYYPYTITLRPAAIDLTWSTHRRDMHLKVPAGRRWLWEVLPEHYPVCSRCGELMPCREVVAEETAKRAITRLGRFETAGVCPVCEEPVTARQRTLTFSDNIEIPGGPPLTFHLRGRCRYDAADYEKRWAAADPANRRTTLTCTGHVVNHGDATYECTALTDCPGPDARHPSYSVCGCRDCHARGPFGCDPKPGARRRGAPPDAGALFHLDQSEEAR